MRIVSLLPSATEIVAAIGLADQLVGVTHECDWPHEVLAKPKVTRTHVPLDAPSAEIDRLVREQMRGRTALYSLDFDALADVEPDLIVTQTLCDVCAVADREVQDAVARLPRGARVVYLEPTRLLDVFDNIREVADAAGAADAGARVLADLRARVQRVQNSSAWLPRETRVALLEWLDPIFSCGHWSPELVQIAGGVEVLAKPGRRSRQIAVDELAAADPEIILIACCGFSVERTLHDLPAFLAHPAVAALPCVRNRLVWVTDGSAYFSRPGPRLIDSLDIIAHLIDPQRRTLDANLAAALHRVDCAAAGA